MFFLAVPRPGEDPELRTGIPRPGRVVGLLLLFTVLLVAGLTATAALAGRAAADQRLHTLVLALVVPTLILAGALVQGRLQTRGGLLGALFLIDVWLVIGVLQPVPVLPVAAAMAWLALATVVSAVIADATVHRIQWGGAVLTSALVVARTAVDVPDAALSLTLLTGGPAVAGLLVRHAALRAHRRFAALHRAALTDGLTDVLNRRGLTTAFPALLARAQRANRPVGVLVVDVDHFKKLNDRFGHDHGDRVLQEVCRIITGAAGDGDLVGRIGGEEMVVATAGSAEPVARRIRARLAASDLPDVTVSIGFIEADAARVAPTAWWTLVAEADRGLYDAKRAGRNTVRRGRSGTTRAPGRPAGPDGVPRPPVGPLPPVHPVLLGAAFTLINLAVLGLCLANRVAPGTVGTAALIAVSIIGALLGPIPMLVRSPLSQGVLVVGAGVAVAEAVGIAATAVDDVTRLFALSPLLLGVLVFGLSLSVRTVRLVTVGLAAVTAAALIAVDGPVSVSALTLTGSMLVAGELVHLVRRDHETAVVALRASAVTDPLTGVANRRGLDEAFARARPGETVTVVALDVDDFKAINERWGHVGGDAALVDLARMLSTLSDTRTMVGRSGGDEFVVLSTGDPAQVMKRVRAVIAALPAGMTVSLGVNHTVVEADGDSAAADADGDSAERADARPGLWPLVARADAGLLAAKRDRRHTAAARRPAAAIRRDAVAG